MTNTLIVENENYKIHYTNGNKVSEIFNYFLFLFIDFTISTMVISVDMTAIIQKYHLKS